MNKLKGNILAIITVSIWSSTFIISKFLLRDLSPFQILFYRFLISTIFLSIIYPKFTKPNKLKEELIFLFAGICLSLYFFFENTALVYTYSSNVSLIDATIPLITGALSVIIFKTKFFNRYSLVGFIIAYGGVILIIVNGNKLMGIEPIGDFYAFCAAFMFSLYTLLMQKIPNNYNLIELTRKVMIYGLMTLGLIIFIKGEPLLVQNLDKQIVILILYLGILASSLAFIMWNKAIDIIGSIKTNKYIYFVPVITTIFSAILINEKITYITIIGTILIISGLYLSEKTT